MVKWAKNYKIIEPHTLALSFHKIVLYAVVTESQ